jgi:hypothetical protein
MMSDVFMPAGNVFSSFAGRARTASAIFTVSRPDCFTTSSATASSPFTWMCVAHLDEAIALARHVAHAHGRPVPRRRHDEVAH